MLQLLQTGKMLYVLAAICALGIVSKIVTGSLYKGLIRETGNMALTKNRNLRALKQRTENLFLLNQGIRSATAYIEKQIYGFRFMKVSLDNWDNLSLQAMILCFLVGGASAFGAYVYRCDSYYIVLYGTMGVLAGLLLVFVDNGANIAVKRQQLSDCLVDYVENSPHFYKSADKAPEAAVTEKKSKPVVVAGETEGRFAAEASGAGAGAEQAGNVRSERAGGKISVLKRKEPKADRSLQQPAPDGNLRQPATDEPRRQEQSRVLQQSVADENPRQAQSRVLQQSVADENPRQVQSRVLQQSVADENPRQSQSRVLQQSVADENPRQVQNGALQQPVTDENPRRAQSGTLQRQARQPSQTGGEDELARSIEQLRISLEQIAAGREQQRKEPRGQRPPERAVTEQARRELRPEDIRLLGELLQEYLT